jgi:hypothetical protein
VVAGRVSFGYYGENFGAAFATLSYRSWTAGSWKHRSFLLKAPSLPSALLGVDPTRLLQHPLRMRTRFWSRVSRGRHPSVSRIHMHMIRKLRSGEYRLYSRKQSESTGKRRNLGTFTTLQKARQHEREVQFFKKH